MVGLELSLILAAGRILTPAADFTDAADLVTLDFGTDTGDISEFSSGEDDTYTGEDETDDMKTVKGNLIPDADIPDSTRLLDGYLNGILYEEDTVTQPGASVAGNALNDVQQIVYEELKDKITTAASEGGSTKFNISSDLGFTWQTTAKETALEKEVTTRFSTLDISRIINCLLADCPYELYWYDKTASTVWRYGYTATTEGNTTTVKIIDIYIYMPVSGSYAAGSYEVNAAVVQRARKAASNARKIVNEFSSCTQTEKLLAYREKIYSLTSYDETVSTVDEYGDSWQLIYVFDGDKNTKVVCEGFAKAFQYLCDLSDISCYTVTGIMSGETGTGSHMWNIIADNNKYYLADVTNGAEDTAGTGGGLFLDTPFSGSIEKGYTYIVDGMTLHYSYDENTKKLYGTGKNSVLLMTGEPYSSDSALERPDNTSITGISNKKTGKLVLSWKKSKNAKGYEIYRRKGSSGAYTRAAVIKSGSTVKYTNSNLKKNYKYYYRIRSYAYDESGKKIYSSWSAVKGQKVK